MQLQDIHLLCLNIKINYKENLHNLRQQRYFEQENNKNIKIAKNRHSVLFSLFYI